MTTKPTTSYWTNNATYRTEPATGRKNTGYEYEDKPAYQHFNWLLYHIYEWVNWISEWIGGWYTIGSNGDYASLNAAIADSKTKIKLKEDLLVSSIQTISLDKVILNFNGFKIYTGTSAIASALLAITGNDCIVDAYIESNNTSGSTTTGLSITGDGNSIRCFIKQNGAGGTLTNGCVIESGAIANDLSMFTEETLGTMTNRLVNNAGFGDNNYISMER